MRTFLLALYALTALLVVLDENDQAELPPVVQLAQAQPAGQ